MLSLTIRVHFEYSIFVTSERLPVLITATNDKMKVSFRSMRDKLPGVFDNTGARSTSSKFASA